ncbi:MAG: response regulator [Desulfobacteraceae bacterium]|nr:response regulator [Desulfobacteraceae bacterium]
MNEPISDVRILIVDDHIDNLRVLSDILKKQGCKVRSLRKGRAVFSSVLESPPDIILLDIMMPDMHGYDVCKQLKADERTRDIPVIFISALHETKEKIRAFSAGGVDYVTKPFHTEEVAARINSHLMMQRLHDELREKNTLLESEIAERMRMEEELRQAKESAEAANQAKGAFLANMSHELRTPMNSILGYAQILRRSRNLADSEKKGLDVIHRSGNHLLTLINDILDIAKAEAGKLELSPGPINLYDLMGGVADIMHMAAHQKNIRFVSDFPDNLPAFVQADEKRLRQILLNLLGNAVKFTKNGSVTLKIRTPVPDSERISLKFEVTDTGIGMSPEEIERVFRPFEQAGDEKNRVQGTGLGLAITRQLVSLMGGEIHAESKYGNGSVFRFEIALPVLKKTVSGHAPSETRQLTGYHGERRKILVVDDVHENRKFMFDMLKPLGFDVTLAADGKEGIGQAEAILPDLILMDLVMPVMTGFDAVREIRRMPGLKQTPIIAVSAGVTEADQEKSRIAGCDDFLSKPVKADKLFGLMGKHLNPDWIYEEIGDTGERPTPFSDEAEIIPPPSEELDVLYGLARLGLMDRIHQHAIHIEELDEKYAPFVHRLRALADEFEDEMILEMVKQFMSH